MAGFILTKQPVETAASVEVEKASITWEHIDVSVKPKRFLSCSNPGDIPRQRILRNVSGHVEAGTLLAILGASGSGKTTLLDTLTCRILEDVLSVSGNVLVNGVNVGNGIRNILAYVPQDDLFIGTLKAMLRMDKDLTKSQRLQRVDDILKELGLDECADSRIGNQAIKNGISGGQMRRLSFASEILTNPPLMFCDEPTSGLDTFMAGNVIKSLKAESNVGRTVLCTIHQPSSQIFSLFDNILIMAEGRVAFMGRSQDALTFFSNAGYPCPKTFNPADFYILTLAVRPGMEDDCREKIEGICDEFDSSNFCTNIKKQSENISSETNHLQTKDNILNEDRFKVSLSVQMSTLLSRTAKVTYRDSLLSAISIWGTLGFALLYGLLFLRRDTDQTGVMDIDGALSMMVVSISLNWVYAVINTFPVEMPIFVREYHVDLYRIDVYYISKMLVENYLTVLRNAMLLQLVQTKSIIIIETLTIIIIGVLLEIYNITWKTGDFPESWRDVRFIPIPCVCCEFRFGEAAILERDVSCWLPTHLIMPIIFCSIAYWMIGLYPTIEAFLIFIGVQMLVANISASFGYLISASSPSTEVAIGLASPGVVIAVMFGGFLQNTESLPQYFVWLEYLSWIKYAYELVSLNQWENIQVIDCNATVGSDECLFSDGQSVIDYLNFDKGNKKLDIILLCVMLVGFRILGFVALFIRAKLSRNY